MFMFSNPKSGFHRRYIYLPIHPLDGCGSPKKLGSPIGMMRVDRGNRREVYLFDVKVLHWT